MRGEEVGLKSEKKEEGGLRREGGEARPEKGGVLRGGEVGIRPER